MSASESRQRAAKRGEIDPRTPSDDPELPSSEITQNNSRARGCCADLPYVVTGKK
jgi:hypothetical protein